VEEPTIACGEGQLTWREHTYPVRFSLVREPDLGLAILTECPTPGARPPNDLRAWLDPGWTLTGHTDQGHRLRADRLFLTESPSPIGDRTPPAPGHFRLLPSADIVAEDPSPGPTALRYYRLINCLWPHGFQFRLGAATWSFVPENWSRELEAGARAERRVLPVGRLEVTGPGEVSLRDLPDPAEAVCLALSLLTANKVAWYEAGCAAANTQIRRIWRSPVPAPARKPRLACDAENLAEAVPALAQGLLDLAPEKSKALRLVIGFHITAFGELLFDSRLLHHFIALEILSSGLLGDTPPPFPPDLVDHLRQCFRRAHDEARWDATLLSTAERLCVQRLNQGGLRDRIEAFVLSELGADPAAVVPSLPDIVKIRNSLVHRGRLPPGWRPADVPQKGVLRELVGLIDWGLFKALGYPHRPVGRS